MNFLENSHYRVHTHSISLLDAIFLLLTRTLWFRKSGPFRCAYVSFLVRQRLLLTGQYFKSLISGVGARRQSGGLIFGQEAVVWYFRYWCPTPNWGAKFDHEADTGYFRPTKIRLRNHLAKRSAKTSPPRAKSPRISSYP